MDTELILYDRIWLSDYITQLSDQRYMVSELRENLEKASTGDSLVDVLYWKEVLTDVYELEESLKHTEEVLREYLENAQEAAYRLVSECENIVIPQF